MADYMPDLFAALDDQPRRVELASGAVLLRGFALKHEGEILTAYQKVVAAAPFRRMVTPGGQMMSVAMTNCGTAGWVTDRRGYRYDHTERDFGAPIVSVSLGLPAKFLFGGLKRGDKAQRIMLHHGDVTVWGGPSRLAFHGIDTLKDGEHSATGRCRINLTFRKAL